MKVTDKRIISRLIGIDEDFKELYEQGTMNYANRPSKYEGDKEVKCGLLEVMIKKLAVYTQDAEQIDRIIKSSKVVEVDNIAKSDILSDTRIDGYINSAIEENKGNYHEWDRFEIKSKEEYMNLYGAGNLVSDFMEHIRDRANTRHIPTGFAELDVALDGGLYDGLYILGAISSLGKTTFTMQIADQVAEAGHDVIIFSLEMSKFEIISKSISRLTFDLSDDPSNAKTSRGITSYDRYGKYSDTERKLISDSIKAYSEYANNIYIYEGVGDIGIDTITDAVKTHIELTGRHPLLIIDYLQILAPWEPRATDKQNTDKAVTELKRLSRDYKIPVFAISSFNRDNYSSAVNMSSFKESGAIEYSSDVLIGLQPAGMVNGNSQAEKKENIDIVDNCKRSVPRGVELILLKNRNGRTGAKVTFEYDPRFNHYKEIDRFFELKGDYSNPFIKN